MREWYFGQSWYIRFALTLAPYAVLAYGVGRLLHTATGFIR